MSNIDIRRARLSDIPALEKLITESMRELGAQKYTRRQIESALQYLVGVDPQLIKDGTYYVAEDVDTGEIAGAGGWSWHQAAYGHDTQTDDYADPDTEAAKIRAIFVSPRWARQGIASRLMKTAESAAERAGYTRLELIATLVGIPLYEKLGYRAVEAVSVTMPDGVRLDGLRMEKLVALELMPEW